MNTVTSTGLAVAVPMYYATRNRWKAMLFVFVSALAEPLGALIAWLFLRDSPSDAAMGVTLGIVGGIMTLIAFQELLPAAHKHDPKDRVSTYFLVGGMVFIALTVVGLEYANPPKNATA
jgi:ZIP family zinc transporter